MYFSKLLVSDIIEFAVSKGADKHDLLRSLDIKLDKTIDLNEHVSYDKMVDILNITGQAINDELLGLHLGEQLILKVTKQVNEIMQSSPTIEEAINNAINYSKLISDALTSGTEKAKNFTKISFELNPNWEVLQSQAVQQIIDMTLVCTQKSIYWLMRKKIALLEVHLPYPPPKKRNEYYRIFDCTIKFNEPKAGIIFSNPILSASISTFDLGLLANLKKVGNEEIKKLQLEHPLIFQIKKTILKRLPQKSTTNMVALDLNLSTRTLQRKLQKQNTNFKLIEKDILIKLAKKFILYEERNIQEISYLLGFSEASAFIRFFKNEMKKTPKRFKKYKKTPPNNASYEK